MSLVNASDTNPYSVTTSEITLAAKPEPDGGEPLLAMNDRTNVGGRLWSPCTQTVYSEPYPYGRVLMTPSCGLLAVP